MKRTSGTDNLVSEIERLKEKHEKLCDKFDDLDDQLRQAWNLTTELADALAIHHPCESDDCGPNCKSFKLVQRAREAVAKSRSGDQQGWISKSP